MCVINVKTYVHPDGRRETFEESRFCKQSDRVNPCYNHTRKVQPDVMLASNYSFPASPSLINDDLPSPMSGSFPGTPVSATAGPRVEFRQPLVDRTPTNRNKGKSKVLDISDITIQFGKKAKKYPSKRRSSRYVDEDEDEIIAIEEDGVVSPATPTRRSGNDLPPPPPPPPAPAPSSPGLGSPFSAARGRRPRAKIHQPDPPYPSSSSSGFPPAPGTHRRTFTAPEPISMPQAHSDNEIWDRANARERLRYEERERRRAEDAQKRVQEEADRRFAEHLAQQDLEKERRERAEDEFSALEYERLQGRDKLRRRANAQREKEDMQKHIQEQLDQAEVEQIGRQIREAKKRQDCDAARRAEERAAKLAAEQRVQYQETRRREAEITARMAGLAAQTEEERKLRQTQEELARLEDEMREARRERRIKEAREQQLIEEVHAAERLQAEIRQLEAELGGLAVDDERGYGYEARLIGYPPASPSSPRRSPAVDMLASRAPPASPYQDPDFRRLRGTQVLEREWMRSAQAQVASQSMQRAVSDPEFQGLVRRNTTGGNRARDTQYRGHLRRYPQ